MLITIVSRANTVIKLKSFAAVSSRPLVTALWLRRMKKDPGSLADSRVTDMSMLTDCYW